MSRIDIVIALILIVGGVVGYRRGFLMELFFLVAIVLGVLMAFKLTGAGVEFLHRQFNANTSFLPYLSFLVIFILVILLVTLTGRRIKDLVDKTFLGRLDAIAGAILGVMKYAFCISVLIWLATSFNWKPPRDWTRESWLYPATANVAPRVAGFFAGFLPFFKEIFRQF